MSGKEDVDRAAAAATLVLAAPAAGIVPRHPGWIARPVASLAAELLRQPLAAAAAAAPYPVVPENETLFGSLRSTHVRHEVLSLGPFVSLQQTHSGKQIMKQLIASAAPGDANAAVMRAYLDQYEAPELKHVKTESFTKEQMARIFAAIEDDVGPTGDKVQQALCERMEKAASEARARDQIPALERGSESFVSELLDLVVDQDHKTFETKDQTRKMHADWETEKATLSSLGPLKKISENPALNGILPAQWWSERSMQHAMYMRYPRALWSGEAPSKDNSDPPPPFLANNAQLLEAITSKAREVKCSPATVWMAEVCAKRLRIHPELYEPLLIKQWNDAHPPAPGKDVVAKLSEIRDTFKWKDLFTGGWDSVYATLVKIRQDIQIIRSKDRYKAIKERDKKRERDEKAKQKEGKDKQSAEFKKDNDAIKLALAHTKLTGAIVKVSNDQKRGRFIGVPRGQRAAVLADMEAEAGVALQSAVVVAAPAPQAVDRHAVRLDEEEQDSRPLGPMGE